MQKFTSAQRSLLLALPLAFAGFGCGSDTADPNEADAGAVASPDAGANSNVTSPVVGGEVARDAGMVTAPRTDTATGNVDSGLAAVDGGAPASTDAARPTGDSGPNAQADAGGDAAVLPSARPKPFCMKKDSQLIVIGDSYINWISHTFPDDIKRVSGQSWRMEAVGGTSIGSGGIGPIGPQFDDSIARDPDAHTILMDGGGNDVLVPDPTLDLFGDCTNTGSSKNANCQKIVQLALDAASKIMDRAVSKGIRDVVYFFYPHVPANTILTGNNPNEILDYALPMVRSFCEGVEQRTSGKLRCTFVDMVPVFEGHKDWFNEDIHPNSKGSAAMADKIWAVMTDKCIGQKGPKDCCETK